MVFQFYCPNGHLLQAEEAQAGVTIACPVCKMEFIIPPPTPQPPTVAPPPVTNTGAAGGETLSDLFAPKTPVSDNPLDFSARSSPFIAEETDYSAAQFAAPKTATTVSYLHIPCPSGHILEVTRDFLGEEAVCPQCQKEFVLRFEKSLEYQKEKMQRDTLRDTKMAKAWLMWSIAAAVGVLIFIFILIYT